MAYPTEGHSEATRNANRAAAELVEALGIPHDYDKAVTLAALAYLKGGTDQLRWARDTISGTPFDPPEAA